MTTEERFKRIETLLAATTEQQARQEQEIAKHNDGIRDLIVVARACLDSIKEMGDRHDQDHDRTLAEIDKLREAQAATDEKLNILIDTVDRIIRRRNGKE